MGRPFGAWDFFIFVPQRVALGWYGTAFQAKKSLHYLVKASSSTQHSRLLRQSLDCLDERHEASILNEEVENE